MNNSTAPVSLFNSLVFFLEFHPHFKNYIYFLIFLNSLCSIVAVILNSLVILTLVKTASLRTSSNIFILSLAISDFGVGIVTQPAYFCRLIAGLVKDAVFYNTTRMIYFQSFNALITGSLLTVTAITIDRFLALYLHLRYQELVTSRRSYAAVAIIWTVSLSWSFLLATNKDWLNILNDIFILIIVIIDVYLMIKISRVIRRHSAQIHSQQQINQPTMNIQRYKKTVNVMNYIIVLFLLCYMPSFVVYAVMYSLKTAGLKRGIWFFYVAHSASTIVFMNSAINPLIYCWRIEEMRNALFQIFRRHPR